MYDVGKRDNTKDKEYVLVEWPYPSGNLHIGHWYAFAVPDIYVRYQRMLGKQVLYPMGFDAFGLPAENAAIKRDTDPKTWTVANIAHMREQLERMGNAFSWDKTTSSTDPEYYKWTQWMFTKFFAEDIAYRGKGVVNWCPGCNTVLANEQVLADDTCERCGSKVEKREMDEWKMRITKYADRLLEDLDKLNWPEPIKESQRNWIGRSQGAVLDFKIKNQKSKVKITDKNVKVFTTRPDTLFGATFMVLAPEHPVIEELKEAISNYEEVASYAKEARQRDDQDRMDVTKEKTGVKLEGITATNPGNGEEIPVFIADYVLMGYGTGAIMSVPAHDERDGEFARKFNLPIKQVVVEFFKAGGDDAPREGLEVLERPCVDLIIEHPSDGTFLLQKEQDGERVLAHFVGGGKDGEDDATAVSRELVEETGFTDYEIVGGPIATTLSIGYRHSKEKNQQGQSNFYHVKLKNLNQVPSEIEDGKHTVEWMTKEEVTRQITWSWHKASWEAFLDGYCYIGTGKLVNSGEFDGMDSEEAKEAIVKKVGGEMANTYRLRDWSVGRQRYWGVPIPIVYDPEGKAHPISEEHLPWTLPTDVDFKPTGEPPLAKSKELQERTEKIFGAGWKPEVETMDTFVDSSWYYLRYIDNENERELSAITKQEAWMPVDLYFGGAEHTTMHLLYSRFWQKALFDLGLAKDSEPYIRRLNRSLVLGPDGNKMSKSKGNVIDPDEQVSLVGADSVKMYLAFMGPYGEVVNYPWDMGGIAGIRRFLERVNGLKEHIIGTESEEVTRQLHKTILKVTSDIKAYKFNTAISAMMVFVNLVEKEGLSEQSYITFLRLLAPFAPHLTEELWTEAGNSVSIHTEEFPVGDSELARDNEITIGVQINGKSRGAIVIAPDATEEEALAAAKGEAAIIKHLEEKEIVKVIYVPGRIFNIIANPG